jgi:acetylornithine/LysW-gamma-L-lysine aminotransferase
VDLALACGVDFLGIFYCVSESRLRDGLATIRETGTCDLPGAVTARSEQLLARLDAIDSPLIREIRGLGLMIGIDLRVRVRPILDRLAELGVLAMAAGPTVLRLLPPLVISEAQVDTVADAIAETLLSV